MYPYGVAMVVAGLKLTICISQNFLDLMPLAVLTASAGPQGVP